MPEATKSRVTLPELKREISYLRRKARRDRKGQKYRSPEGEFEWNETCAL